MSDDWTNDAKAATKALHKSFENEFHTYPARFLKETKDGAKGKELEFNGDQRPFYAIQAYVWSGMLYPENTSSFEAQLPKPTFEPVAAVAPTLYEDTENTLVSVSSSCHKFSEGLMGEILSYSSLVKVYAKNAKESLSADDGLTVQLKTLQDEKYDGNEKDGAFQAAKDLAHERLMELEKDAKEKDGHSKKLLDGLTNFNNETEANQSKITALADEYMKPVTNSSGQKYSSVLAYIHQDVEDLTQKLKDLSEKSKGKTDELKEQCNPKGWKFWITALSGVGGEIALYKELKDWKEAMDQWADQNKELAHLVKCSNTVTALNSQIDELLKRMKVAIHGIQLINNNFRDLGDDLDPLIKAIDKIDDGTGSSLLAIRESNIQHGIREAVSKYDVIIQCADDFEKKAHIQVTDA